MRINKFKLRFIPCGVDFNKHQLNSKKGKKNAILKKNIKNSFLFAILIDIFI